MAWKKLYQERDGKPEVWISIGKEKEGYEALLEGDSIIGFIERITQSEKFDQPIISLLSEDKSQRYLLFSPPNLTRQLNNLMELMNGKSCLVKITYLGKKQAKNKEGLPITYHAFEVEYDDEKTLEE